MGLVCEGWGSPEHRRQGSRCREPEVGSETGSGQQGKTSETKRDRGEDEGENPAQLQRSRAVKELVVLRITGMIATYICIGFFFF